MNDIKTECPFCGGENLQVWHLWETDADHVVCLDCRCCGPKGDGVEMACRLWDERRGFAGRQKK